MSSDITEMEYFDQYCVEAAGYASCPRDRGTWCIGKLLVNLGGQIHFAMWYHQN